MKLNKLLLTSSLVPIAIVPAMVTSCNKNKGIDDFHLMVVYDEDGYFPKGSIDPTTHEVIPTKYAKGFHSFVLEQVDSSIPVYQFGIDSETEEWIINQTNFNVMWNEQGDKEQDITDWWEPEGTKNFYCLKQGKTKITKGKLIFNVELLKDMDIAIVEIDPD